MKLFWGLALVFVSAAFLGDRAKLFKPPCAVSGPRSKRRFDDIAPFHPHPDSVHPAVGDRRKEVIREIIPVIGESVPAVGKIVVVDESVFHPGSGRRGECNGNRQQKQYQPKHFHRTIITVPGRSLTQTDTTPSSTVKTPVMRRPVSAETPQKRDRRKLSAEGILPVNVATLIPEG